MPPENLTPAPSFMYDILHTQLHISCQSAENPAAFDPHRPEQTNPAASQRHAAAGPAVNASPGGGNRRRVRAQTCRRSVCTFIPAGLEDLAPLRRGQVAERLRLRRNLADADLGAEAGREVPRAQHRIGLLPADGHRHGGCLPDSSHLPVRPHLRAGETHFATSRISSRIRTAGLPPMEKPS